MVLRKVRFLLILIRNVFLMICELNIVDEGVDGI